VAGCFFKRTFRPIRDAVARVAMIKDAIPKRPMSEIVERCQRQKKRPQTGVSAGTVSMQMMQEHHRH
jgi:hypothetical protein